MRQSQVRPKQAHTILACCPGAAASRVVQAGAGVARLCGGAGSSVKWRLAPTHVHVHIHVCVCVRACVCVCARVRV